MLILIIRLRSLCSDNVAHITPVVGNLVLLLLIKLIIFGVQRVRQARDASIRVQRGPGLGAGLGLAALEHHHEGVEPALETVHAALGLVGLIRLRDVEVLHLLRIGRHVVQLVLVSTPDGIVPVIPFSHDAQGLVSRVDDAGDFRVDRLLLALGGAGAPVLDLGVLEALTGGRRVERNGGAVEVAWELGAGHLQNGGCEIRVGGGDGDGSVLLDARPADDERHVDVFFVGAVLAGEHAVLADVEAVVGRVDDVGIVEEIVGCEVGNGVVDDLVDGLQRAQAVAVVFIAVGEGRLVLLRQMEQPVRAAGLVRVEVFRARHLFVGKVFDVFGVGDGPLAGRAVGARTVARVRSYRCHGQEEGLLRLLRLVEEGSGFVPEQVRGVVVLVHLGSLVIALIHGVIVVVRC